MDMIRDAAHAEDLAVQVVTRAAEVLMRFLAKNGILEKGTALFC